MNRRRRIYEGKDKKKQGDQLPPIPSGEPPETD